jgi:hypothetical protein
MVGLRGDEMTTNNDAMKAPVPTDEQVMRWDIAWCESNTSTTVEQYIARKAAAWGYEQARTQQPAPARPVAWMAIGTYEMLNQSLRDNVPCVLTTTRCAANTIPLYAPQSGVPADSVAVSKADWPLFRCHTPVSRKARQYGKD